MSTDAAYHDGDRDRDKGGDSERGDKTEKAGSKQKSSGTKSKDLSHVPCKFFKVGGCTAGASCPFSHVVPEPGQKEVCTWFVKGNCKFGHKCALAHILPGQSMAMDRKNKKAAQTAASANSGDKIKTGGKVWKKDSGGSGGHNLPLLAGGSTAPTRILNSSSSGSSKSGRPPINMSLKATISPSAPAPPLKDTDFASFATLDGLDRDLEPISPDEPPFSGSKKIDIPADLLRPLSGITSADLISLPPSAPRPSAATAINDFGPIGSPPNYRVGQPISPIRTNGSTVSPATSPRHKPNMINPGSPSHNAPLSAPGNPDYFSSSFSMRGQGIPQSLGSGLAMKSGRRGFDDSKVSGDIGPNSFSGLLSAQLSSSVSQTSGLNGLGRSEYDITIEYDEFSGAKRKGMEIAVEDEELEDFLPSSLNDLLTPEERIRRMSRSNSGQKSGISHLTSALASANLGTEQSAVNLEPFSGGNGNPGLGHRYSHSVPAPTLLADIKSIWSDPSVNPMPSSPLRGGIPSANISATLGSGSAQIDDAALSISMGSVGGGTPSSLTMISPSNASAAFLPGLHKHYLDAKAKQAQQAQLGHSGIRAAGLRGASNPLYASNGGASNNPLANNYLQPLGTVGLPSSVSNSSNLHMHVHGNTSTTYRTTPSPFDLTQTLHQAQPHPTRPISNLTAQASTLDDPLLAPTLLSPGSRALQSHAPGQSLPQGLAAGYSRIHALPPLTNITSPSNGSFIPGSSPGGAVLGNNSEGPFGEWTTMAGPSQQQGMPGTVGQGVGPMQPNPGLNSMFSRLSYAATTRNTSSGHAGSLSGAPPGLARNISGGKYNHSLSPLSGPVARDDDILFDMDK